MFNSCDIEYLFNVKIKMNLEICLPESISLVKCTVTNVQYLV